MLRPELPPESVSKFTPTFQFPKSLLQPLIRPLIRLQNSGWLPGVPLQQHVVICGFPRSGTTLCQLMIEACVPEIKAFGKERRGLEIAKYRRRTHSRLLTKRPKDIFLTDEIRDFHAAQGTEAKFIVIHRDPRAVLTSLHFSRPNEYYVSAEHWAHIYRHWKWSCQTPDVLSVSYEDLIQKTHEVQRHIQTLTGWKVVRPFEDFHKYVPQGFDGRALNGLRELEPENLNRWRDVRHRQRVCSLLSEMPELPQTLIEMGYETDAAWTHDFARCEIARCEIARPAA